MSSAVIPPASIHHPIKGATALGPVPDPGHGAKHPHEHRHEHRHLVGNALRAVKVFATAAFSVAILGEYADDDDRPPAPAQRSTPGRRPTETRRPIPPHTDD